MVESFNVRVGIDSSDSLKAARQFDMSTKKISQSADKMDKRLQRSQKSMAGMGNAAFRLKRALGVIGVTGFSVALIGAARSALAFDKAMTEVSTLIDDSFDPTNSLSQVVRNLSKEFAQAPVDQAKALYQVISAGATSAAEATKTLTAANKLAVGGVTDVATAADGLTSILNAYGLTADSATEVSDAMFVAMRAGKTTIGELSGAVGLLAPIAAQTGVSFQEMLGSVAALTKGGLSTSQAMTGLRQAMVNVLKPTKQGAAVAEDLGIQFNATALKTKGLVKFMEELRMKAAGNTDALVNLFGSVEGLNAMMALTAEAGAKDLAAIMDSMEGGIGSLIETMGLATGEGIEPLKGAIEALTAPTQKAMEAAAEMGIEFSTSAIGAQKLTGFMEDLTKAAENDEQKLIDLFGSMENYNAAMEQAANDGGAGLLELLQNLETQMGQTDIAVNKVTASTEFQAKQVKAQLTDAFLGFGQALLIVLGPAIEGINENFETMMRIVKTAVLTIAAVVAGRLVAAVATSTVAFIANTVALTANASAALRVTSAAGKASIAMTVMAGSAVTASTALAVLGGPAGIIMIAVAALAAWAITAKDAGVEAADLEAQLGTLGDEFKKLGESQQLIALEEGIVGINETEEALMNLELAVAAADAAVKNAEFSNKGVEEAKERVVDLKAEMEGMERLLEVQTRAWLEQAQASGGAAAAFANTVLASTGLGQALADLIVQQAESTVLTSEQIAMNDRLAESQKEQQVLTQGLTKTEQRRFGSLKAILNPLGALQEELTKDIQIMEIAYTLMKKSVEETAAAKKALTDRFNEAKAAIEGETNALTDAQKALKAYDDKLKSLLVKYDPVKKAQEALNEAIAEVEKLGEKAGKSIEEVAAAVEALRKAHKKAKLKEFREEVEDLKVANDAVAKATLDHKRAVEALIITEGYLLASTEERAEALRILNELYIESIETLEAQCDANKKVRECTEDSVDSIEKLWERGLENIQDAFADAFKNIFDGADNAFDGIKDAFKDMISNMLAQWASSGLLKIFNGFGGGFGGASGSGFNFGNLFGGGGGAVSGALTGVDVFNMGRGGIQGAQTVSAAGSTAVGGTGMFANTPFIGAFTAAFTAAGGFAGGLTGAASSLGAGFSAGFASIPVIGWILAGAALNDNLFAKGFQPNTGDMPEQFGFNPAEGGMALLDPSVLGFALPMLIDKTLQKLGVNPRIASLIGGSAGPVAQFGRKAPRAVASGLNLSVADGKIIAEGFVKTVASGGIFRSSKRKFKTTELDEGFIESLQNSLDALLAPFEQLIDVMGGNTDELKSFNIDTERLRLQEFTKKGKPKFSDEEISEKLEVFLRETVHDAVVTFLRNTDSLAEEFKKTVLRFSADTEEMLMALQLVTSISNNLNANFVADIQEAQAMATRSGTQALADNIVILREAITAYDGSMESLINLESAYSLVTASQFQLIGALLMVKDGVEAMFNNTRNAIAEAGLDDETLYNMRSDRIDELTVQLSEAIDPTEIAAIADEINRLTISSFGLLDEGQQLEMKDDFLTFLDDILMLTNERIDAGIAAIEEDAHTLNMEVSGAMQGAADTQVEAANDFRTGVNDFRGGVRDFRDFVRNGGDRQFGGDTDNVQEVRP